MLFHRIISESFLEIYLNLEELICLKHIINQPIYLIPNHISLQCLDLHEFNIIEEEPAHKILIDISDYVCMFENDTKDIIGSEFLSYRNNQKYDLLRLEIFDSKNFEILLSRPNLYENKYYHSDHKIYMNALKKASQFGINFEFEEQFGHLKNILPIMPLMLPNNNDNYAFNFKKCYVKSDINIDFIKENDLEPLYLKKYLDQFHPMFKKIDENLLFLLIKDNINAVYGSPYNNLFNVLAKYKPEDIRILNCNYGLIENFQLKTLYPHAFFEFSKKYLNCSRTDLLSCLRFKTELFA